MNSRFNQRIVRFPFNPSDSPLFYGWVVLIFGIIGSIMSVPGQTVGVSVFTDKLIHALNINRTQLSFCYMIGTGLSAFVMTFAGFFYDRFGARIMATVSSIILGGILVFFSFIDHIISWLSDIFITGYTINTFVIATLAFFMLRLFGQGILTMVSRNMIMKWFDAYRGFANGILGVMIAFGFSYAPRYFNDLIEASNWRMAWINVAFILFAFALLAFIFFRDDPYESGLRPDGQLKIKKRSTSKTKKRNKVHYTLKQAVHTYAFWIFTLGLFMSALYITAFTFHVVSIFGSSGLDKETAISIFLPAAIVSVFFHFVGSWLSDYVSLKYHLLFLLVGLLLSMISILYLENPAFYIILIVGNGMAIGMFGTLIAVTWPKLFGTKHLGAISGFSLSWIVAGSAVGPFIFSLSFNYNATYAISIKVLIFITAFLIFLSTLLKNS